MKKTIYMMICFVLIAGALFGCVKAPEPGDGIPPAPDDMPQVVDQMLKAMIQEVHDGQLLVVPIEGLGDIDIIYLNFNDEAILNVSDGAPLEPGTIIYARIDTAIMESYPPQVHLFEIIKTEKDASALPDPVQNETVMAPDEYITGKVIEISGEEYTIEVLSANLYEGEITIKIPANVLNADMPIVIGNLIGVYVAVNDGDLITAEKLVFSEPDALIELDNRETVSGYLNGLFPMAIFTMADKKVSAQAGMPFAIAFDENCESEWEMAAAEGVTLAADGISPQRDDGYYTRYFGISIAEAGEYTIVFIHHTADGDFDFSFDITVQ